MIGRNSFGQNHFNDTSRAVPELRVGISGWNYAGWRGKFYPPGLPHRRELEYASRRLNSIEINGSFYSLQTPSSYRRWHEQTPPGFVFALKGSRFITHMKKLADVRVPLANFLASGVLLLKEKLGPILWQFPERFAFRKAAVDRFAAFLELLPRTTTAAAALAAEHDQRLVGRAWTDTDADRPLRHALEVRHASFLSPEFAGMLRAHGVALVFADTAGKWPYAEEVTAPFLYLRLHGSTHLYASGYTDEELDWWAARIRAWSAGAAPPDCVRIPGCPPPPKRTRDAYVYFDNDAKVHAPFDALRLVERLEG